MISERKRRATAPMRGAVPGPRQRAENGARREIRAVTGSVARCSTIRSSRRRWRSSHTALLARVPIWSGSHSPGGSPRLRGRPAPRTRLSMPPDRPSARRARLQARRRCENCNWSRTCGREKLEERGYLRGDPERNIEQLSLLLKDPPEGPEKLATILSDFARELVALTDMNAGRCRGANSPYARSTRTSQPSGRRRALRGRFADVTVRATASSSARRGLACRLDR